MKYKITKILPFFIAGFVALMLGSLYLGWLNPFFYAAEHASVQGIDFFPVPKSYLNLLEGRSIFDTWGGAAYGPYGTWYLAHPAFSVFVASWFSFFSPWKAYFLFTLFTISILGYCAHLISKTSLDPFNKRLTYVIMLCAFPTYWLMFIGNMHAPLVLALTFILLALFEFAYSSNDQSANRKLMLGLIISFFSKPIVLLMLPLLLLVKETRRTTIKCLIIYGFVSILFIVVPFLNPQAIGLHKLMHVAFDFDFIKEHMNIYKNNFVLNEYMKDNSIHWLNLIAQSDYKLMHIDVFSLPVFMDTFFGHETSASIYKIPIYLSLIFSIAVGFIKDKKIRLECSLLLVMAISLTFFLSYNTVWEYQFTSALPVVALLPMLKEKNVFYKKYISIMLIIGCMFCLPTFYFLLRNSDFNNGSIQNLIRFNRVIPAVVLFGLFTIAIVLGLKQYYFKKKL